MNMRIALKLLQAAFLIGVLIAFGATDVEFVYMGF